MPSSIRSLPLAVLSAPLLLSARGGSGGADLGTKSGFCPADQLFGNNVELLDRGWAPAPGIQEKVVFDGPGPTQRDPLSGETVITAEVTEDGQVVP